MIIESELFFFRSCSVDVTLEDGDSGTTMNESTYTLKPAEQITHTVVGDTPPLKRTQLRRSLVWRHFERLDSLNAAQCSICMKKVQCFKYGGTSNLRRHMSKRHPKVFSELEANGKNGITLNSTQQDSNATNGTQGTFRAAEQRSFQGMHFVAQFDRVKSKSIFLMLNTVESFYILHISKSS